MLSADGVEKAKSGHPGLPLGSAPMAFTLWERHMRHNPANPKWPDRDRFVLSAGHGSMLLYSLLHLFGYGLTIDDLKQFRQLGSKTPGHPEYGHTVGVETTTGPLGQGISNAVGFAIAEAHLAAKFNRDGLNVVDHYTYALCGDGCMMEGISGEASSLAGTLKLGKLIVLYDDNDISIEGNTDIAFREDVGLRYEAYGWHVQKVADGNDVEAISAAIEAAKEEKAKPSLIIVKTQIGYGCPAKQGKASAHGEPLGADNVKCLKENLGWPADKDFYVPDEVYAHMETVKKAGQEAEAAGTGCSPTGAKSYPDLAQEWDQWFNGKVPEGLLDDPEFMKFDKPDATRNSSGTVLNRLAAMLPNMIGGSADLAPSNKTDMKGGGDFSAENYAGRNMHFGVREHAMAAIGNGMALHGGLRPFVATFFVFSDYMKHVDAAFGAHEAAARLCADARQHRRGRGRPHPPAHRAARDDPQHTRLHDVPPGGRARDGRRVGLRPDGGRPHGPGADAPEPAALRGHGQVGAQRGVYPERSLEDHAGHPAAGFRLGSGAHLQGRRGP